MWVVELLKAHYDVPILVVLLGIHVIIWVTFKPDQTALTKANRSTERHMAATIVNQTLSTGLTAVSIILPIVLVGAGLLQAGATTIPEAAKSAVIWSIPWLLVSAAAGLYAQTLIPKFIHSTSVAYEKSVNVVAGFQFISREKT